MALSDAFNDKKFDNRLTDQNLKNGTLTESEKEQYLNSLPDCAELAEPLKLFEEPASTPSQEAPQQSQDAAPTVEGGYVNGNGNPSSLN